MYSINQLRIISNRSILTMCSIHNNFFLENRNDIEDLDAWVQELKEIHVQIPQEEYTTFIQKKHEQEVATLRQNLKDVSPLRLFPRSQLNGFRLVIESVDDVCLAPRSKLNQKALTAFDFYLYFFDEAADILERIKSATEISENEKKYFLQMQLSNIYKTHTRMKMFFESLE